MKTLSLIITGLLLIAKLQAQNVLLSENFTTYAGTAGTAPAGWTFSYHGSYSSAGYYGPSGPNSYKFGESNAQIISPSFSKVADTLTFWMRRSSGDVVSYLVIEGYVDLVSNWDTLIVMDSLPTSGTLKKYILDSTTTQLRFTYIKSAGNLAFDDFSVTTSNSADFIAPVITLIGPANMAIFKDSVFTDPGATALDDKDGDITNKITVIGSVNTSQTGTYLIHYNVSDLAGNPAQEVNRVVTVIDSDTIPPVITLNGANPFNITVGGSYPEPGATALDNVDGNLTSNITITGKVDTSKRGSYQIIYSVADISGNVTTVIREVNVYTLPGKSCAYPFFSEYIEPVTGNTKVLEIFNPTDFTIDMSEYVMHKFINGDSTSTLLTLMGTLQAGMTYIISNNQADSSILVIANMKTTFLNFNGNDGLLLMKGSDTLDIFGKIRQDPGTEWINSDSTVSTKDMSLRRKAPVTMGIVKNPALFDPSLQWMAFAPDDFSGLGSHTMDTCDFTTIVYNEFNNSTENFNIFPNPAQDKFKLLLNNNSMNISGYEIRDMSGKIILKNTKNYFGSDTHAEINISALKPGFYFLTFNPSENSQKSTLKFIIIR